MNQYLKKLQELKLINRRNNYLIEKERVKGGFSQWVRYKGDIKKVSYGNIKTRCDAFIMLGRKEGLYR